MRYFKTREKIITYISSVLLVICSTTFSASAAIIDDIKADAGLNEGTLLVTSTAGWTKSAIMGMGNAPRGDATPYWWTPANTSYKALNPWTVSAQWFVIYPAVDHKATNVRVKISGLSLYFLSKSKNTWKRIDTGNGNPTWADVFNFNLVNFISKAAPRIEADGSFSYKLDGSFHPIHGGGKKIDLIANGINPSDISAIFGKVDTQLILDDPNGIDDRANARLLVSVGADYYPDMVTKASDFAPVNYVPNSCASRYGLVGSKKRTHYMANLDIIKIPSNISPYVINGGIVSVPLSVIESNPPYPFTTVDSSQRDTTPPTLSIVNPQNGSTVKGNVSVDVNANDNIGISKVDFYVNGALIASDNTTPFSFIWDSKTISNAGVGLSAIAYDSSGNKAISKTISVYVSNATADTTPPSIVITSPSDGSVLNGSTIITSTASDNSGASGISQSLYIDGSLKTTTTGASLNYSWNSKNKKTKKHTISITAKDKAGNVATKTIYVYK